jgi:hypothetical protein
MVLFEHHVLRPVRHGNGGRGFHLNDTSQGLSRNGRASTCAAELQNGSSLLVSSFRFTVCCLSAVFHAARGEVIYEVSTSPFWAVLHRYAPIIGVPVRSVRRRSALTPIPPSSTSMVLLLRMIVLAFATLAAHIRPLPLGDCFLQHGFFKFFELAA